MMPLILMTIESPEDRNLFTRLYAEHAVFLVNAAYRMLDDWAGAEDAVQDVIQTNIRMKTRSRKETICGFG